MQSLTTVKSTQAQNPANTEKKHTSISITSCWTGTWLLAFFTMIVCSLKIQTKPHLQIYFSLNYRNFVERSAFFMKSGFNSLSRLLLSESLLLKSYFFFARESGQLLMAPSFRKTFYKNYRSSREIDIFILPAWCRLLMKVDMGRNLERVSNSFILL